MSEAQEAPQAKKITKRKPKGAAVIEKRNIALETLKIEYLFANTIKPNSYNPNRQSAHEFHMLVLSMLEDGFTQPVIVQAQKMEIIDGEHRWTCSIVVEALRRDAELRAKALAKADEGELIIEDLRKRRLELLDEMPDLQIPMVLTDMSPEQARIATLRHNRARGSEDYDLALNVLKDLRELGALDWAADSLQLDDVELNKMLEDLPAPESLAGDVFSQAWEPNQGGADEGILASGSTQATVRESAGGGITSESMTAEAIEESRRREQQLKQATTEEERAKIRKESNTYRVVLIYANEEAEAVKAVLGAEPAVKLLEMCRREQERTAVE